MPFKIKYVDYGLANKYGNLIELNRGLLEHPRLHEYVLKHEKGHKESFDLQHEFKLSKQVLPLLLFVLSHPKSWIDFLPIQKHKRNWVYDLNLICLYGITILISGIIAYLFL